MQTDECGRPEKHWPHIVVYEDGSIVCRGIGTRAISTRLRNLIADLRTVATSWLPGMQQRPPQV